MALQASASVLITVVTPAGKRAELSVPPDFSVNSLKTRLVEICQVPVDLQQLVIDEVILEDSQNVSAYVGDGNSLTVTMVATPIMYALASGAWQHVWATGQDDVVLKDEDVGEELIVDGSTLKVEKAYAGPAVQGDANIWAKWGGASVTLDQVVVVGFCIRVPWNGVGCCTMGLTVSDNLDAVVGGFDVLGNVGRWKAGSTITYTPSVGVAFGGGSLLRARDITDWEDEHEVDEDQQEGRCVKVVLVFHRSKAQVLVAQGERVLRLRVEEQHWPAADQELVPFIVLSSKDFVGFETLQDDDLPVFIKALPEDVSCEQAFELFQQIHADHQRLHAEQQRNRARCQVM